MAGLVSKVTYNVLNGTINHTILYRIIYGWFCHNAGCKTVSRPDVLTVEVSGFERVNVMQYCRNGDEQMMKLTIDSFQVCVNCNLDITLLANSDLRCVLHS